MISALFLASALAGRTPPPPPPPAFAPPPSAVSAVAPSAPLDMIVGGSQLIQTARPVKSVINSNPKAVKVTAESRRSMVLFGEAEGRSELRFLDAAGAPIQTVIVTVLPDEVALQEILVAAVGPGVRIRRAGSSVALVGEVENAGASALAADLAQKAVGTGVTVTNLLKTRASDQITVSVKVLEVKASRLKSVGVKWAAINNRTTTGQNQIGNVFDPTSLVRPGETFSLALSTTFKAGRTIIDAYLDLLKTEGQAKLLAAPAIVATSGKPAKFLAGGEFPVPYPNTFGATTSANGAATNTFSGIFYKQYGISLSFTAVSLPDGRIDLLVAPEVSSIDRVNSIEYGGNRVPALATRRAEANLRLASGESVVFAGLTSHNDDDERSRFPVGNSRFLDFFSGPSTRAVDDTELVIIVTPVTGAAISAGMPAMAADRTPGS